MGSSDSNKLPALTGNIVHILTPVGRGAVATIAFSGDCGLLDRDAPPLFQAANGQSVSEQDIGRIVFGRWGSDPAEDVVLCRIDDRNVEIHCHGGSAAVERIVKNLQSSGCKVMPWQEALGESQGTLAAECTAALAQASTLRTAAILLDQQAGALQDFIESLRASSWTATSREQMSAQLDQVLRWADFGRHLVDPWKVAVIGRPNVGKSSLINALVGYTRAIVFDQPGTTRDVVTAETAFDGWPTQLADTAGIRTGGDALESAGIELARSYLATADCHIVVLDRSVLPHTDDGRILDDWADAIIVANKVDLSDAWADLLPPHTLHVSALTQDGLEELIRGIVSRLVPDVPPPGTAVPVTERQVSLLKAAQRAADGEDRDAFHRAIGEFG